MRQISRKLRDLYPMANFTTGEAAALANEYAAWVKTYGIKEPPTKSELELFTTAPAAFLHNPDEIREQAEEYRHAIKIAIGIAREGHASPTYTEDELRANMSASHYGGAMFKDSSEQFYGTHDEHVCAVTDSGAHLQARDAAKMG